MRLINELNTSLNEFLSWDKRRIDCLSKMLIGIVLVQSTNLKKLACAILGRANQHSSYRRLQRFLSGFAIDYNAIARLIAKLFSLTKSQHYLIYMRIKSRKSQIR